MTIGPYYLVEAGVYILIYKVYIDKGTGVQKEGVRECIYPTGKIRGMDHQLGVHTPTPPLKSVYTYDTPP